MRILTFELTVNRNNSCH